MDPFRNCWEGRTWIEWGGGEVDIVKSKESPGFKVLSYNVYADKNCSSIRYSTAKQWSQRKVTLLEEIKSYNPEIICLQDADHYADWWQPQLMNIGYDTIWKKRTSFELSHQEGVVIAYKRTLFQLFKTIDVEFNRAAETEHVTTRKRCYTDDVAIIALLQPCTSDYLKSALCVVSATLYDGVQDISCDVRQLQTKYLVKEVEIANRDFQVPVILGISLNDSPSSDAYHVLRTGRTQLQPSIPKQCRPPHVVPFCRGSARVSWYPVEVSEADPSVLFYEIAWRIGGNRNLGYRVGLRITAGDCIQYVTVTGETGRRRTVAQDMRGALIVGLSSETPFEFKVRAINEMGEGPWSEGSIPICLPKPLRTPSVGKLQHLFDLEGVLQIRAIDEMSRSDVDVTKVLLVDNNNPLTATTPRTILGVPDRQISRARVLPLSTNPRQGWTTKMKGEMDPRLREEIMNKRRLMKSVIMKADGTYMDSVSDSACGDTVSYSYDDRLYSMRDGVPKVTTLQEDSFVTEVSHLDNDLHDASHLHVASMGTGAEPATDSLTYDGEEVFAFVVGGDEEDYGGGSDRFDDEDDGDEPVQRQGQGQGQGHVVRQEGMASSQVGPHKLHLSLTETVTASRSVNTVQDVFAHNSSMLEHKESTIEESSWELQGSTAPMDEGLSSTQGLNKGGAVARRRNDDIVMDCNEAIYRIGIPNKRQIHSMSLRSAYEFYGLGGEPLYTCSNPDGTLYSGVSCKDYLFFSASMLNPTSIASIPLLTQLRGDDPREALCSHDAFFVEPPAPFSAIFNRHAEINVKKTNESFGKLASRAAIDSLKTNLNKVLLANDGIDGKTMWGGRWVPLNTTNVRRTHSWLPNDTYCSSRIALCAHFQINEEYVGSYWT